MTHSSLETTFWVEADRVKRRLFNRLRQLNRMDYRDYRQYRGIFDEIPTQLVREWNQMHKKSLKRLRGYLYETLFYFVCL